MIRSGNLLVSAAIVASIFGAREASALTINLVDYNNSVRGTAAQQGFDIAAHYWSSLITTDAVVNLQVGYGALGSGILASTSSTSVAAGDADIYRQLAATGNSPLDAIAVANLRPLDANGGLSFITNSNAGGVISKSARVYDTDDSLNNRMLDVNTAVMKALGFTGYDATVDGRLTMSSIVSFDFDPSDGIGATMEDFIAVAIHEMGHALGFTSGVDTYDFYAQGTKSPASGAAVDLNNSVIFSTLDLFRYSGDPGHLVPGGAALDLSTGGSIRFSIDGSKPYNGAVFSTGQYAGNGSQASHFKDSNGCGVQIGIMDPTFCHGQMGVVTGNDIAAIDALGWNIGIDALANPTYAMSTRQIYASFVGTPHPEAQSASGTLAPEPASWAMMLIGFGLVGGTLRRRAIRFSAAT